MELFQDIAEANGSGLSRIYSNALCGGRNIFIRCDLRHGIFTGHQIFDLYFSVAARCNGFIVIVACNAELHVPNLIVLRGFDDFDIPGAQFNAKRKLHRVF